MKNEQHERPQSGELRQLWNKVLQAAKVHPMKFLFSILKEGTPTQQDGKLVVRLRRRLDSTMMNPYLADISKSVGSTVDIEYQQAPEDGSNGVEPVASSTQRTRERLELEKSLETGRSDDSLPVADLTEGKSTGLAKMPWIERGGRWFPVPVELYEPSFATEELTVPELAVYEALWYYAWLYNKDNWLLDFWVDDTRLADTARVSVRTVQRARKRLHRLGLILCWRKVVRVPVTGSFVTPYHYELIYPVPRKVSE